jgi:flagellar protein FliO/FliZ
MVVLIGGVSLAADPGLKQNSTDQGGAKGLATSEVDSKDMNAAEIPIKTEFDEAQINYPKADDESLPILTKNKNKVEEQSGAIYKTVASLFVVAVLGALGLWYLKKKSLMGNENQTAMQIKVLTQYHLAPRKTLTVIRVAGESLLLGVTENQISLIKALSLLDEDIPEATPKNFQQTIVDTSIRASEERPPKNTILKSPEFNDSDEEFSFGSIKHLVENKLKGMKRW